MELKELVCNLKLSKELVNLGVKQDTYFWWHKGGQKWYVDKSLADRFPEDKESIPAPTFAELLEVLPDKITNIISKTYSIEKDYYIHILKTKKSSGFVLPDYFVGYKTLDGRYLCSERADTIADAAGKMVIYLIKEGIIEVKKDV